MRRPTICRHVLSVSAAALLASCGGSQPPIGSSGASSLPNGDALPYHKTFHYTGGKQIFMVPSGVTTLHVVALGGNGAGANGGRGGRVSADIPVTAHERLVVYVGGNGVEGRGGFNGRGDGGKTRPYCKGCPIYGGGGASDVRVGGHTLINRILVVGGGAGAGGTGQYAQSNQGGRGGKGGGITGGSGASGSYGNSPGGGGSGGTQDAGGLGGAPYGSNGAYGENGSLGKGGDGGIGGGGSGNFYGGGGGGGYYGGGGGAGGGEGYVSFSNPGAGGGGGGGSSYVEPSASNVHMWQGWKTTKAGLVVFAWSRSL